MGCKSLFYFDTTCVEVISETSVHVGQKLNFEVLKILPKLGRIISSAAIYSNPLNYSRFRDIMISNVRR